MKYFSLLVLTLGLVFYTNTYSDDFSVLPSLNFKQSEGTIATSKHTSHQLILANGMPLNETPEPQPAKDLSSENKSKRDKYRKEVTEPSKDRYEIDEDSEEFVEDIETISDPLEPYNRAIFQFNDKFYFYSLKPIARGYRTILPKKARICIRKFLSNAATPARFLNCALQGKIKGVVTEPTRFALNTTLGIGGLFDPAQSLLGLKEQEVDFDQTLGLYGMKPLIFINLPLLGPSSVRGIFGLIGDTGFDPSTYFVHPLIKLGITSHEMLNETSLTLGEYEELRESALDPYIAIRNAYFQNRRSKIESQ